MATQTTTTRNGGAQKPAEASNGGSATSAASAPKKGPPAGYAKTETGEEILQYWDPSKGPIHGKLIGARDFRRKDNRQIQRIYIFDLAEPIGSPPGSFSVSVKGKLVNGSFEEYDVKPPTKEERERGSRELVGVWGSAGLSELDELGGCFCYIERRPEKKKLDGNRTMWVYDVHTKGTPKKLHVAPVRGTLAQSMADGSGQVGASNGDEELPF